MDPSPLVQIPKPNLLRRSDSVSLYRFAASEKTFNELEYLQASSLSCMIKQGPRNLNLTSSMVSRLPNGLLLWLLDNYLVHVPPWHGAVLDIGQASSLPCMIKQGPRNLNLTSSMISRLPNGLLLWLLDNSLVHVPPWHGAVFDIGPQTENLIPRALTNVLSDALMLSRSVVMILPTTLTTRNRRHMNWGISLRMLYPFQGIVTVGDSLIWSSCILAHNSQATQCHATPERSAGSISVVSSCSSLLIISQRSPESHIYAPLETFSLQTQSPSQQSCLLIVPHVISTRTGCRSSSIRYVRGRSPEGHCSLRPM